NTPCRPPPTAPYMASAPRPVIRWEMVRCWWILRRRNQTRRMGAHPMRPKRSPDLIRRIELGDLQHRRTPTKSAHGDRAFLQSRKAEGLFDLHLIDGCGNKRSQAKIGCTDVQRLRQMPDIQ